MIKHPLSAESEIGAEGKKRGCYGVSCSVPREQAHEGMMNGPQEIVRVPQPSPV